MEGDASDPEVQATTQKRIQRAIKVLTQMMIGYHQRDGASVDETALRARAVLMDLQLQYFCFHVVLRGLDISIERGIWAMAEQWYCAIHHPIEGV
jgi:hypothetical protein